MWQDGKLNVRLFKTELLLKISVAENLDNNKNVQMISEEGCLSTHRKDTTGTNLTES